MTDCIFCKIVKGETASNKVYEDEYCYAFRDIEPQAPVHILVIPKRHIESVSAVTKENSFIVGAIFEAIAKIAASEGIAADGYRVISNIGVRGQQTVPHLHFHVLGGRDFTWPPG